MIIANVLVRTSTTDATSYKKIPKEMSRKGEFRKKISPINTELTLQPTALLAIPKGGIGFTVHFEFESPVWKTLSKTVVFRNSRQSLNSILSDDCAVIPHELLDRAGDTLFVGIYGIDSEQSLAIPTVWAILGEVVSAATPAEDTATEATLPYWAQIQEKVDALEREMMSQADLETALLQAKQSGAFDGPQGPQGEQGEQGEQGLPGYSPVIGVDYWTEADQELITAGAASMAADRIAYSSDIVCESGGNVIALADAAERELKQLRIFGKTTQDGTPTPDEPVALESVGDSGSIGVNVCGKNLLPYPYVETTKTANGITFTDNGDGSVTAAGTTTAGVNFEFFYGRLKAGDYILSTSGNFAGGNLQAYDATNKQYLAIISGGIGTFAFSLSEETLVDIYINAGSADTVLSGTIYPMLRFASVTDSTYEPYKTAQTITALTPNGLPGIPVSSGGNYTDADGQMWICDEVDFAKGVYVQRIKHYIVDESTKCSHGTHTSSGITYGAVYFTDITSDGLLSDRYMATKWDNTDGYAYVTNTILVMNDTRFTDAETMLSILVEEKPEFLLVLATPIETALTADELAQYAALHTNKPNTTVYNDAGAYMEAEYVADTKTYIDNKFAELAAAIVANA